MSDYQDHRREYGQSPLIVDDRHCPLALFDDWLAQAVDSEERDPTAFVLSTVSEQGPDSRVVLLKKLDKRHILFYSHYQSAKGQQMDHNPNVSVCFYWPTFARQVRAKGRVCKVSADQSRAYFESRPILSQKAAAVSPQSQVIESRADLEHAMEALSAPIACPTQWGGYQITIDEIEFFQGRDNRLNDRKKAIISSENDFTWQTLAP